MTEIISILSGKGGVGKTFISINLSAALSKLNKKVLLIDMNLTTPNIITSLKIKDYKKTIHDILKGHANPKDCIINTEFGFDVIVGSLKIEDLFEIKIENINKIRNIKGYDYIILDSSAGIGRETLLSIKLSDRSFIISNPNKSSIMDAYRISKLLDSLEKQIYGVIINKYRKKVPLDKIELFIEKPIFGVIREDKNAEESMNKGIPLLIENPFSDASIDIMKIAEKLTGEIVEIEKKESIFEKILKKIWK